jgi:hypothetical protein
METLRAIIKEELIQHYEVWVERANDRERKGLRLIQGIVDSKGRKKMPADPIHTAIHKLGSNTAISVDQAE